MVRSVASAPVRPQPVDVAHRAEQVLEVLRDLRERDAEDGGSAGPELDEAIREFTRVADRLRADAPAAPAVGVARGDDGRPV